MNGFLSPPIRSVRPSLPLLILLCSIQGTVILKLGRVVLILFLRGLLLLVGCNFTMSDLTSIIVLPCLGFSNPLGEKEGSFFFYTI